MRNGQIEHFVNLTVVPGWRLGPDDAATWRKHMTPEKRAALENTLAEHGLTVMLTSDHKALLQNLARLAQFERLMQHMAEGDMTGMTARTVDTVRMVMACPEYSGEIKQLQVLDIPEIITEVHRDLHKLLDDGAHILPAWQFIARAAFIAILTGR